MGGTPIHFCNKARVLSINEPRLIFHHNSTKGFPIVDLFRLAWACSLNITVKQHYDTKGIHSVNFSLSPNSSKDGLSQSGISLKDITPITVKVKRERKVT